jgi:hypothetical protein
VTYIGFRIAANAECVEYKPLLDQKQEGVATRIKRVLESIGFFKPLAYHVSRAPPFHVPPSYGQH